MTRRRVYFDNSATTPVDPRVAAAMARAVVENFGNASSVHGFGQQARAAVDRARREVAALIGAKQNEIVFTSGGTEANNLAIRGLCEASTAHGRHVITSAIEHPSVAGVCLELEKRGWEVTRLPVYRERDRQDRRCCDSDSAGHCSHHHHAREQRNRHDSTHR